MKVYLLPLLFSACLFSAHAAASTPASPPNVLVILADDLGYSDLGCYGGEIPTPHLDRLAASGARFDRIYSSARCCPSRAALMTGLHPHEAGIGSFATAKPEAGKSAAYTGHLLPNTVTLAELLKARGYSTWMVGKWHLGNPGPIERGFEHYYGYKRTLSYAEDQWNPAHYVRLPAGDLPAPALPAENFYATDVFTDYALAFINAARQLPATSVGTASGSRPWFLYLSHSSPHFPVQAPKATIDKYYELYLQGWDVLRAARFARMKKLGLVAADATLPPLSLVPLDQDKVDINNGYGGQRNPDWASLPENRRRDLARRMATYAAMVEHVDTGVGRILADLEAHGDLANTLIIFTSDNGACYEWGPFGFDQGSRKGITILHEGAQLDTMGQPGTSHSYGSAWANLCNTPLNMYKHFCHEGGISSPLIMHWPAGQIARPEWIRDPAHMMDLLPTIAAATGATYPTVRDGQTVQPASGLSLLPTLREEKLADRPLAFEHQGARGLRHGDWKIVWSKRQLAPVQWELYNLKSDPSEQHDLATAQPDRLAALVAEWNSWAKKVGVDLAEKPTSGD